MGFDWKKSKAHWLLLSKFIHGQNIDNYINSDFWECALCEHPNQAIRRFVNEDLLALADLENTLTCKYNVTELKDLLKQRGLPVSGKKGDMIQRLLTADPIGMKKSAIGLTVYICTINGKGLAEQYLIDEKEKRNLIEKQVMEYIQRRMFREASIAVAAYEAEQVFPRNGLDWNHHNIDRDVELLTTIYKGTPKILSGLENDKFESLRLGAAMMYLWGKSTAKEWLPPNFKTGTHLNADTAARMFWFYASHKTTLENYRHNSDVVDYVKVSAAEDSCEACKKLGNKKYKISEFPELPYEHCTHKMGCRCAVLPVVKGFDD
jgi:hypothetical protein